jgi:hypothetical protein
MRNRNHRVPSAPSRALGLFGGIALLGSTLLSSGCAPTEAETQRVQGASELGDIFYKYVLAGNDKTEEAFIKLGSDLIASYTGIGTVVDVIKLAVSLMGLEGSGHSVDSLMQSQLSRATALLSGQIARASWNEKQALASTVQAHSTLAWQRMNDVANGAPLDDFTRNTILNESSLGVSPFLDDSWYKFAEPGQSLLFDHRLALPLFTNAIAIRILALAAWNPDYVASGIYAVELNGYRDKLGGLLKDINDKLITCYTHPAVPIPSGSDPSKFVTRSCINKLTNEDITVSTLTKAVPEASVRAQIMNQMGMGPVREMRDALFLLANNSYNGSQICAGENHTCVVAGQASVRYGAVGSYFRRTANQSIGCNNGVWGDPIPGTWKACSQVPVIFTPCVGENDTCYFSGPKVVRYGAAGVFNSRLTSNWVSCDNLTFGDPIYGSVKACDYADPVWTKCADDKGRCTSSGTTYVRYGSGTDWTYYTMTGSFDCNFPSSGSNAPRWCEIASGF